MEHVENMKVSVYGIAVRTLTVANILVVKVFSMDNIYFNIYRCSSCLRFDALR